MTLSVSDVLVALLLAAVVFLPLHWLAFKDWRE
jgi:hypothetical protein